MNNSINQHTFLGKKLIQFIFHTFRLIVQNFDTFVSIIKLFPL